MTGIGRIIDVFAASDTVVREQLGELVDIVDKLEPDARELLLEQARRLIIGQRQYGRVDLDTDRRNFVREALEECLDQTIYTLAALKRLERRAEVQP